MPFKSGQVGNPNGGPRKRPTETHGDMISLAESWLAARIPKFLTNLETLANGGYERVEEQYAPAGSLYVGSGKEPSPMYPDKDPDELVLVKRTVIIADKDRLANEYLLNRIMGKPTERTELTGGNGGPLVVKGYTTKDATPDAWDESTSSE
jgi:hypothetical protein